VIGHYVAVAVSSASLPAQASWLTVGPDYQAPTNSVPANYKAAEFGQSWKEGQPLDNRAQGSLVGVFGDTNLNALESQACRPTSNSRPRSPGWTQARDTARVARAIDAQRESGSRVSTGSVTRPMPIRVSALTANTFSTPLDLSYEVDLWGRVRRSFESARADAQASLADYYNVLLTLQVRRGAKLFFAALAGCGNRHGGRHRGFAPRTGRAGAQPL
jgi:multidrug efflux system outer membrane protein